MPPTILLRPGLLPLSVVAAATFAALAGCSAPPPPAVPPPPKVVVGAPLVRPIVEWDEFVGRLEAVEFVEVRARVSGYLQATHFVEGQIVPEGALLAVIDPRPYAAEVKKCQAALEEAYAHVKQATAAVAQAEGDHKVAVSRLDLAEILVERQRRLRNQNVGTQEDLDNREAEFVQMKAGLEAAAAKVSAAKADVVSSEAAVTTAQAALGIAQLNLEYTEVRAPVAGRLSRRNVTDGNLVSGGTADSTLLTTIVSLDPIHCVFDADEQSFLKYVRLAQEGKRKSSRDVRYPVFVGLGDEPGRLPHQGQMDFVDNRLDPETDTMRARALLPNADLSLSPGLFTRVRIPGSARYQAILVPDSSIATDQSEKFVMAVDAKNVVERRVVQLGSLFHGLRIVRKGLDGSERIILRGLQRVRPGDAVTTTEEKFHETDDGMPDDYSAIPEDQWILTRSRKAATSGRPASGSAKPSGETKPAGQAKPTTEAEAAGEKPVSEAKAKEEGKPAETRSAPISTTSPAAPAPSTSIGSAAPAGAKEGGAK